MKSRRRSLQAHLWSVRMDALEPRRMLTAATVKHGLLTVYGSDGNDTISVADAGSASANLVAVTVNDATFQFRGTGITRMRILGEGGADTITLGQTYTPNLTDVAIYAGDGGSTVVDQTVQHRFNRGESVSLIGGSGNDILTGGAHTVSIEGGAGNDTLSGGEAGATLDGGDGDDVVSANPVDLYAFLTQTTPYNSALGGLSLNGGAGDDILIGNNTKTAGITDTLAGGDGNDTFNTFSTDQILDFGDGTDVVGNANQHSGSADVSQNANLSLVVVDDSGTSTHYPANFLGYIGSAPKIWVADSMGTIAMQGPAGSTFQLGDLLEAAGYPVAQVGIPSNVSLTVNGFPSTLTGNQIAGYQINSGDMVQLNFNLSD